MHRVYTGPAGATNNPMRSRGRAAIAKRLPETAFPAYDWTSRKETSCKKILEAEAAKPSMTSESEEHKHHNNFAHVEI